uniref:Uncharacterized protein n=1 Tax=Leptobrachium leishanense TaxID=445787 RepID=A0A8C5WBX6_9ANUR
MGHHGAKCHPAPSSIQRGCPIALRSLHFTLGMEDYFNWRSRQDFHTRQILTRCYGSNSFWELPPHKTYSTRKGALVLFSEDLALPWHGVQNRRFRRGHKFIRKKFKLELNTLQDLTGAILSYGRKQETHSDSCWKPYLHILSEAETQNEKQIRPGYSPKRYLARLFENWDPNTMYRLQKAGSLRDSAQLQHLATHATESSKKHQDLSSAPLKYQCLPVYASLPIPRWSHSDAFPTPGRCTPVQEEAESEEELDSHMDIGEEKKHIDLTIPSSGTMKKVSGETTSVSGSERSMKQKERFDTQKAELLGSLEHYESVTGERNEHVSGSFWNDSFPQTQAKSNTTYYGGPFTGRRRYQYVKQDLVKVQCEKETALPQGGFLPPIHQSLPSESVVGMDSNTKIQEPVKLPPIMEETSPAPQRKRRLRAADPPKELLVIPLLVQFESQKTNQEESIKSGEGSKEETQAQGTSEDEHMIQPLTDDVQVPVQEGKFKALEMDIDWNVDPQPDGDILPMPETPPVGSLPPINGKKGPGNQSSMANLKAPNANTTLGAKTLPTGIIRGSLPEELKECCKGSSMGSLIMSPNGEIVCLSIMGSTRETDIPVRFDFITEQDEDCPQMESTGQEEEEWSYQQNSEQATGGSNTPSLQPSINSMEEETTHEVYKEKIPDETKGSSQDLVRSSEQEDDTKSNQRPPSEKTERRGKDRSVVKSIHRERTSQILGQKTTPDIVVIPPGHEIPPSETDFPNKEDDFTTTEDKEVNIPPKTPPISTLSPDRDSQSHGQDQSSMDKGLGAHQEASDKESGEASDQLPSSENQVVLVDVITSKRKENEVQEQRENDPETHHIGSSTTRKTLRTGSASKVQELQNKDEKPVGTSENRTAAPPSVHAEYHNNQHQEGTVPGPKKQQTTKQKTSERTQPTGKSSEIMDNMPTGKEKAVPIIPPQHIEEGKAEGIDRTEDQMMKEEDEMTLLNDVSSSMKEKSRTKEKRKSKGEKTQKPSNSRSEVGKKSKQSGVKQQGKAAFVVGQPKEKKKEGSYSPKKPSKDIQRQDTIHETQDTVQEEGGEAQNKEAEEEEIVEGSDEDSFTIEIQEREPTPPPTHDLHYEPEVDTTSTTSGSGEEQQEKADKLLGDTLGASLSQINDDDFATSETSGATSGSLLKRRSSRAQELSEKAERRRIEVERKRREKEEQIRLEKEQQERMEKMRLELEEEQRRRGEENR